MTEDMKNLPFFWYYISNYITFNSCPIFLMCNRHQITSHSSVILSADCKSPFSTSISCRANAASSA